MAADMLFPEEGTPEYDKLIKDAKQWFEDHPDPPREYKLSDMDMGYTVDSDDLAGAINAYGFHHSNVNGKPFTEAEYRQEIKVVLDEALEKAIARLKKNESIVG